MQLFYDPDISEDTPVFAFDKNESRHILRVLRKKEGDHLQITNGKGKLLTAEIVIANDKKCSVKIIASKTYPKPRNYNLHIAIAPTKMNDRFEWFVEKATEIGIDEITPIICDNSERKVVNTQRIQKVIIAAAKQSLKYTFPKLNEPVKLKEFFQKDLKGIKLIAHCEDTDKNTLKTLVDPGNDLTVLIGPEGDFSSKEIELALHHKYIPLSLGKSRLRTETAGIVVCNTIAIINE